MDSDIMMDDSWTVDICGYMWIYVDICGYMWIYVDICGYMWIYVDICGYMWIYVDIQNAAPVRPSWAVQPSSRCTQDPRYSHRCRICSCWDGSLQSWLQQTGVIRHGPQKTPKR